MVWGLMASSSGARSRGSTRSHRRRPISRPIHVPLHVGPRVVHTRTSVVMQMASPPTSCVSASRGLRDTFGAPILDDGSGDLVEVSFVTSQAMEVAAPGSVFPVCPESPQATGSTLLVCGRLRGMPRICVD